MIRVKLIDQNHFFLDPWSRVFQHGYRKTERWGEYRKANPNLPEQSNTDHQNALDFLFQSTLLTIGSHGLKRRLLFTACKNHELGEVDNGDTLFHDKTIDKHTKELLSFDKLLLSLEFLNKGSLEHLRRAFILQFVVDDKVTFKDHSWAEEMLEDARKNFSEEGRVFNALETLDYVLHAIRCYRACKDVVILKHVYSNQVGILDGYMKTIQGFDKWWGEENSKQAKKFMKKYSDIPGPKDEGGIKAAYDYAVAKGYMTIW